MYTYAFSASVFYPLKNAEAILREGLGALFGESIQRGSNLGEVSVKVISFSLPAVAVLTKATEHTLMLDLLLPRTPTLEEMIELGEVLRSASSRASILISQVNRIAVP